MSRFRSFRSMLPVYSAVLLLFFVIGICGSHTITVISENTPVTNRKCVIIDAGHGGEDGGATSCTGVPESKINLQIALRLEDLMHLLGIDTYMIRRTDVSVYTQGNSIASKKVSDLKNRVAIVNSTSNATLVSIHQNHFTDSRYSGAQVFYAKTEGSEQFAKKMQAMIVQSLNPGSNRQAKQADGVYLMQHIVCTGVLVECGFLSNPEEEALLQTAEYQKKLCCVLASVCSVHLSGYDAIA